VVAVDERPEGHRAPRNDEQYQRSRVHTKGRVSVSTNARP
jgi:hypothetical protein